MSNYNTQLQSNNTDLQTVLEILQTKAAGSEQATPIISVSSNGLITATAGTKSATKQLAFQPAKTITPTTTNQIAVSSGYYTGGNITIKGDANLVAENIKSGISIFGVSGTLEEGGGMSSGEQVEWSANEDAIIDRTISGSYFNDRVTAIGLYAFRGCSSLTSVNFPACTSIDNSAFYYCKLTSVNFPACTSIGYGAFDNCTKLTSVNFPVCTSIGYYAFFHCDSLTSVSFPACITIGDSAFGCTNLTSVSFPACISIRDGAFKDCYNLISVNFPACTSISSYAFIRCSSLTSVNFPACTIIRSDAFENCSSLTSVNFPACTSIGYGVFSSCISLTSVSFPACTSIGSYAFSGCYNLKSFYLTGSRLCKLVNSNAFTSTPYAGYSASFSGTPYIYVPSSLLTSYQTATNWAYFSSYFSAINLITFTIDDISYQAEEGMTWEEWCNSDYNTGEFFIDNDGYVCVYANNTNRWVYGDPHDTSA